MTENMAAGLGEGVKGLQLCPSCQAADNNPYTNANGVAMRACSRCMIQWRDPAALEAAARLPAAPEQEASELLCANCGHSYAQHTKGINHPQKYCRHCPCLEWAALATPSPQAPQQESSFSTTSVREQSSATASDNLSAAAGSPKHREWLDVAMEQGCQCGYSDAWHCAIKQGLKRISCPCHCHKYISVPAATQEPAGSGALRETKEQYEARMLMPDLCLRGKATDHIWLMEDVEGYIGIRLDCGDAGTVYMTNEQARDLALQVMSLQSGSPRKVGEDGALKADDYRLVPVRLIQRFGANVPGNESDTRWTVCLPNGDYAHLFPEYLLARPSSVPVGEQKQEEGV